MSVSSFVSRIAATTALHARNMDGRFDRSFSDTAYCVTECDGNPLGQRRLQHFQKLTRGLSYNGGMSGGPHILIVDDHREIRELVTRALVKEGFRVSSAADGRAMHKVLADGRIDLILLDLMLPGEDGLSLCRALRAKSDIPIIMLTAKGDEIDRVLGLEMGADDYMPKPFGSRELIARIRAVLRRGRQSEAMPTTAGKYSFDRWHLDTAARELTRDDGVTVPLSTGEYDLLMAFVERPQRVHAAAPPRISTAPSTPRSAGCARRSNAIRPIRKSSRRSGAAAIPSPRR